MKETTHILAFGAHADDAEIGMGGTIHKWASRNKKIVICDLTEAELSSNGSVALRKEEAQRAADCLGVKERINLGLPDRGISLSPDYVKRAAEVIRHYQPKVIFAPYSIDRHPDHGHASQLVREAAFSAGIGRFQTDEDLPAWKAPVYYYVINGIHKPHFVIDISNNIAAKMEGLKAYKSQFEPDSGVETPLTSGYLESVLARDRVIGKEAGCLYAEGFMSDKPFKIDNDLLGE
ncbi:bacillithiol biosynthesis deacetylase BshB1 [Jeotgalibacillus proteolyticus]|uniref:Bacillithiol biosynthesis deacetylase BshB1 n=1 Tax=Jeotgalibacillus proteolyticus TaxID=2082395 RepID=A0A2S5GEA9_9BACL|nr:bacillithiol biosynthesis deacetylase BshB1 [Jeotgalibacillus proteolyticus]PPA71245.1 bacillithiol biosynthesis deacetylase BshB1 [Jeotgalibacillus proteolyticus]